jgi:hypothetical protein
MSDDESADDQRQLNQGANQQPMALPIVPQPNQDFAREDMQAANINYGGGA